MKKCVIFTGGEMNNYSAVNLNNIIGNTIICADYGYIHAKNLGLEVDIVIGDFDSVDEIPTDAKEVVKFPKEKDDTDTMLAVKLAIERGFDHIDIYGALGKRLDHSYANIQTLDYILENNSHGKIISDTEEIFIIKNQSTKIPKRDDFYLSLFSYSERCEGVFESGVKYPLDNATVTQSFPIGISNEIINDFAEIEVKNGKMLIILSKK